MRSRTRRLYTSAGQKKPVPDSGQPPELARVRLPSANPPHGIVVKYRGVCAQSDCGAEIMRGEEAFYSPEDKMLYCLRCVERLLQAALADGRTSHR
jgi:hypothetical protein